MKITNPSVNKTFRMRQSTVDFIKNSSASLGISQNEIIERGVELFAYEQKLKKEESKMEPNITILQQDRSGNRFSILKIKVGGYVILEATFNDSIPIHAVFRVLTTSGLVCTGEFIDFKDVNTHFLSKDNYVGQVVCFSVLEPTDYVDSL